MITFKISFLLAFYSTPPVIKKENLEWDKKSVKRSPKLKKTGKKSKSKSSMSSKSKYKGKQKKDKEELAPKPEYILEAGNPIGHAHIEYELIPGRPKQAIDVICWNKVAKIFVDEATFTFKCKIADEMVWVPIFVEHCVNSLETKALIEFYSHSINFVIFTNKKQLSERAKSEKNKQFYIRQEDVNADDIVFAYTDDPNVGDTKVSENEAALEDTMHDIIIDCINKSDIKNRDEILTRLKFNDDVHTFRMHEIIRKNSKGEYMCFKEYITVSLPPSNEEEEFEDNEEKLVAKVKDRKGERGKENKKARKKKLKMRSLKSERKEQKSVGPLEIKVNSEVFFTNPRFSAFHLKQPNNVVSKAFVLLSVDHLMTIRQKYELNPLVIRINKIDNLPADVLKAHNFRSVFIRYKVPHIAQGKTMEKNIDNQVRINEAHAHFTNGIPNIHFSEFMTTRRLCIEICGVIDSSQNPKGSSFGSEVSDKLLWRKLSPDDCIKHITKKTEIVVLAIACYDLSSLVMPTWDFLFNESCHNPDNLLFQKLAHPHACHKFDHVTTANINLKIPCRKKSGSPLTELILMGRNTCLKVEAFLSAPTVHIKCDVIASKCFYTRMFLTLFDKNLTKSLLNDLLLRNQYLNEEIVTKSPLQRTVRGNEPMPNEWITGFMIDNFVEYSFFIEGLEWNIAQFWSDFSSKSSNEVKVFYNSTSKFEKRLYAEFLPIGGVYIITLHRPLRDILALLELYLGGSAPIPCWQALKKLDLLYRCKTNKDMLQFSLFPTVEEIYSLDLEFGVPLHWKELIHQKVRRGTLIGFACDHKMI